MGIVGLNFGRHIVDELLRAPADELIEVVAVCDLDSSKVREVASRTGIKAALELQELLDDHTVEAIGLFSSPVGRAQLIRRCINAGKHVMTTKPFEVDPEAAMNVLTEARALGLIVHLNSPSPLMTGDLKQVLAWQSKYDLGRPIACHRSTWVHHNERADGSWYDDPEMCPAAPILRLGIYCINDMVRLLGDPQEINIVQSRIFTGRPTADNAQLGILFRNGAIGSVFASFCVNDTQFYANSMTLNFERGTVYRNVGALPPMRGKSHRAMMSVVSAGKSGSSAIESAELEDTSGQYQWKAFYLAVRGEKLTDEVTPQQIVAGVKIISALSRAQKHRTSDESEKSSSRPLECIPSCAVT
jgi:predicted dehydrogenase